MALSPCLYVRNGRVSGGRREKGLATLIMLATPVRVPGIPGPLDAGSSLTTRLTSTFAGRDVVEGILIDNAAADPRF